MRGLKTLAVAAIHLSRSDILINAIAVPRSSVTSVRSLDIDLQDNRKYQKFGSHDIVSLTDTCDSV